MRNPARVAIVVVKALVVSLIASIAIVTGMHDAEAMPCSPSFAPPDGAVIGEDPSQCLRVAINVTATPGENAFVSATITNLWHTARVSGFVSLPPGVGGGCDSLPLQELSITQSVGVACMLINGPECGLVGTVNTQWFPTVDDLRPVANQRTAKAFGVTPALEVSAPFTITEPCPEPEPEPDAPAPGGAAALPSAVTIEKVASPRSLPVGSPTTWTMTVTNIGVTTLTNVQVTTPLGAPLDPVLPLATGQSWDPTTRTLTTSLGTLAVGQAATVVFDTTVLALSQVPVTSTVVTSEGVSATTADDVFGLAAPAAAPEPAVAAAPSADVSSAAQEAPQLAFTGAETPVLALLGTALLAAGSLCIFTSRRAR